MEFKAGDLVYCKEYNNIGYLTEGNSFNFYPLHLGEESYTLDGSSNIFLKLPSLIKIPKTYLMKRIYDL